MTGWSAEADSLFTTLPPPKFYFHLEKTKSKQTKKVQQHFEQFTSFLNMHRIQETPLQVFEFISKKV